MQGLTRCNWGFFLLMCLLACQKPAATDSHARLGTPAAVLGPGEIVGDRYLNSFLEIELPLLQGWEVADRKLVESVFAGWEPSKGVDSIPSTFLLTTGRNLPASAVGIKTNYFLQIEPVSFYPNFNGNPESYLLAMGQQLVDGAGQRLLSPARPDTLGGRIVYRMDVAFQFGEFPGRQTYFTWATSGLFVNLVFTYADEKDWSLLRSQVIEGIKLAKQATP